MSTDTAAIADTEAPVQAPAPAFRADVRLDAGELLVTLQPTAPRPFSPVLEALLTETSQLIARPLRQLRGVDNDQALDFVVGEVLGRLRARAGLRRLELVRKLAERPTWGELLDALRLELWLSSPDASDKIAQALGDLGVNAGPSRHGEKISEADEAVALDLQAG
jgi:hypothetical protein